jgi:tetratricopeptide (TPR) repeat protein
MIPSLHRTRVALAVALLAVCVGQSRAEGTAGELYARTLRGAALILTSKGSGTGWVIDLEQGVLVTNEHVVTTHEQVEVVFPAYGKDGRPVAEWDHYRRHAQRFAAEVIDADGQRDLAVIRLRERPPGGVAVVKLAEREPQPGDRVHSIGNPDASGALWVYSAGTVRQVYRKEWRYGAGPVRAARVVETQSAINPGDSGGPVVNDAGDLVAVVSGKKTDASLMSWCIAAAEVKEYFEEVRPLIEPKTAAAFQRRGLRALERGLTSRAVEDLSEAYRLAPKSADVLADRAMAHRARKDYDLALDDCNEALKLEPRHAGAFNLRGCVNSDRGQFDEALKDFRRAVQVAPRNAQFHANRAFAHASKQDFGQAIRCYNEALRLAPGVAEWHYRRGLALEQYGDAARADEDYAQAVRLDPSYRERVVPHKMRLVQVVNRTGQKLRIHLRYESQGADGRWAWLPGKDDLTWEVAPGATAVLLHDGRPVVARRIRIWADGLETNAVWHAVKNLDVWVAPAAGYRGGAKPELYTYTFNP